MSKIGFELLYAEIDKYKGISPLPIATQMRLNVLARKVLKKEGIKVENARISALINAMTRAYRNFTKGGFREQNAIAAWRIVELKKAFKEELKSKLYANTSLIKAHSPALNSLMEGRIAAFLGGERESARALKLASAMRKDDKKIQNTINDQTRKFIGTMSKIIAEKHGAIAFIWNGREDKRVAGNPKGLYPDADKNSKTHGDHWHRQNKIYFYKDSWAMKQKLINKRHKKFAWAIFADGLPSEPINCRCWTYNIYELEDIVDKLGENILTPKGKEFLKIT